MTRCGKNGIKRSQLKLRRLGQRRLDGFRDVRVLDLALEEGVHRPLIRRRKDRGRNAALLTRLLNEPQTRKTHWIRSTKREPGERGEIQFRPVRG